jgi:hypothetical protein
MEAKMKSNLIQPKKCFIHKCAKKPIILTKHPDASFYYCPICEAERQLLELAEEARIELLKPTPREELEALSHETNLIARQCNKFFARG